MKIMIGIILFLAIGNGIMIWLYNRNYGKPGFDDWDSPFDWHSRDSDN